MHEAVVSLVKYSVRCCVIYNLCNVTVIGLCCEPSTVCYYLYTAEWAAEKISFIVRSVTCALALNF